MANHEDAFIRSIRRYSLESCRGLRDFHADMVDAVEVKARGSVDPIEVRELGKIAAAARWVVAQSNAEIARRLTRGADL